MNKWFNQISAIKIYTLMSVFFMGLNVRADFFCKKNENTSSQTVAQIAFLDEFLYSVATDFFIDIESVCFQSSRIEPIEAALLHTFLMWIASKNYADSGSMSIQYKNRKIVFSKGLLKTFACTIVQLYTKQAFAGNKQFFGGCLAATMARLMFELLPKNCCLDISPKLIKKE